MVEVICLALGVLKDEPLVGLPLRCPRRLLRKRGQGNEGWSVTLMIALLLDFREVYFPNIKEDTHLVLNRL